MSTRFMPSACMARAAAALPSATASCTASPSSKARSPRPSAASAAISPEVPRWSTLSGPTHPALSSPPRCRLRSVRLRPPRSGISKPRAGSASDTHIVPLFVGDPEKCKRACDILLEEHGIYIQPINYPTVAKGSERLRITPSPYHDDGLIDQLAEALVQVWDRLGLPLREKSLAAE